MADHGINAFVALEKLVAGERGQSAAAGQVAGKPPTAKVARECQGVDGHVAVGDGQANKDRILLEYEVSCSWEVNGPHRGMIWGLCTAFSSAAAK